MFQINNPNPSSSELPDTSEIIEITPLALIKMLRHSRAGVPVEVMGLLLGELVDDYKITIFDVFAMPQTGTGVTVEAMDPEYQQEMMYMFSRVNRPEPVIGWYHSHPGFGCWLSNTDVTTAQNYERLQPRSVSVVVDPIQSVCGKVVLDAFRSINQQNLMFGVENRQITSNIGFLTKPTLVSLLHGVNRQYYSFHITFSKRDYEIRMLANLCRKSWTETLRVKETDSTILKEKISTALKNYKKMKDEEKELKGEELEMFRIGRTDYRRELLEKCNELFKINNQFLTLYNLHKKILN